MRLVEYFIQLKLRNDMMKMENGRRKFENRLRMENPWRIGWGDKKKSVPIVLTRSF